jgi:hypothetical protein
MQVAWLRDAWRIREYRPLPEFIGIDQNVKLNRALWMLADAMRQMKA